MLIIGLPREKKANKVRVGLTPAGVRELASQGHKVVVEKGAGQHVAISDQEYEAAGAYLVEHAEHVFEISHLIVKVKEPKGPELAMLRQGQVLLSYPDSVSDAASTQNVLSSGLTCVAYEAPSKIKNWYSVFQAEQLSPLFTGVEASATSLA
ncbi:hypothetical protein [Hahella ganghwensis]|uniref:hypothetical protein n=1 Tax=Hahella ganghwensis TaxID=286420 RepID=UPI000361D7A9|nr:hypothetical protein [Hahella ganghwensis]